MRKPPIFFFTGPPAVGKTTLAQAVLKQYEFGLHIPVDDLREWVVSGISHPLGWTEETTRQFGLAEHAACDLAIRYNDAGFAVAIDHCQGPPTLDKLIHDRLADRTVHKIAVVAEIEINHERNRTRSNKAFNHEILTPTIDKLNPLYKSEPIHEQGWILFDNTQPGIEEAALRLLKSVQVD